MSGRARRGPERPGMERRVFKIQTASKRGTDVSPLTDLPLFGLPPMHSIHCLAIRIPFGQPPAAQPKEPLQFVGEEGVIMLGAFAGSIAPISTLSKADALECHSDKSIQ